jgi:hypothetical protein
MFDEFTNNLRLQRPENPIATMIKDAKKWIDECGNFNWHLDSWEEKIISFYKEKRNEIDDDDLFLSQFQTDKEKKIQMSNKEKNVKLLEKRLKFILTFSSLFNDEIDYGNCDCLDREDDEHYANYYYHCTCKFCNKDDNSDCEEWTTKIINGVTYHRNVY